MIYKSGVKMNIFMFNPYFNFKWEDTKIGYHVGNYPNQYELVGYLPFIGYSIAD